MKSGWRESAEEGGLLAHGPNGRDLNKRVAAFVDRILNDTKPAELPVEQPTTKLWSDDPPMASAIRIPTTCSLDRVLALLALRPLSVGVGRRGEDDEHS